MKNVSRAVEAFIRGDMLTADFRAALRPQVLIAEDEDGTLCVSYSGERVPRAFFKREDVVKALDRAIASGAGIEELSAWAGLVTLLDFFDLAPGDPDSDEVWEVLTRVSHPEQSGVDDIWRLRDLRSSLVGP